MRSSQVQREAPRRNLRKQRNAISNATGAICSASVRTRRMSETVVFFFQAEDGIRDYKVTGVQTCALPIFLHGDSGKQTSPVSRLSDRELEVLALLGEGLGSKDVAQQLHLSQKTVDSHRTQDRKSVV